MRYVWLLFCLITATFAVVDAVMLLSAPAISIAIRFAVEVVLAVVYCRAYRWQLGRDFGGRR